MQLSEGRLFLLKALDLAALLTAVSFSSMKVGFQLRREMP
jgi:hypothetical protein